MTEDEAFKKWCPFKRLGDDGYPTAGMNAAFSHGSFCIGSECMAWRWNKGTTVGSLKTPRAAGCPEPKGNCGLAGKK